VANETGEMMMYACGWIVFWVLTVIVLVAVGIGFLIGYFI
jgi:hypothetical protein